jgi:hypothetical protein
LNITIQILSITTETKPTAKGSYQQLEIAYKDLSNQGKVSSKKIMSFTDKKVFDTLAIAKPTAVFDVSMAKNDKGYWDWKEVKRGEIPATNVDSRSTMATVSSATSTTTRNGWETPEERAKKQVYIIRQSSLSTAVQILAAGRKGEIKIEEVLSVASQLEDFVFGTKTDSVVAKDVGSIEDLEEDIPF